jgi:hypothetical protein
MREWILVLLAAGMGIGWLIQRRRGARERQALAREARDARAKVFQMEKKLRHELEEARTYEAEARGALDQQTDRFSEQRQFLANAEEEVRRAQEGAAGSTTALTAKSEEAERLQQELEESRREITAAKAEAQRTRGSLHEATARIEEIEAAAQTSAKTNDELRQALEEERRQRRGSAERVAELEAEMRRLKEEGWPAKVDDRGAAATTVEVEPLSPELPESPEPKEEKDQVKEIPQPSAAPADVAAESGPAVEQEAPASAASGGPTFLDVLDADGNLNDGQRETIRVAYSGFAPKATKGTDASIDPDLTVVDVLDADPNLNWGQRETIRALYTQFVRKVETRRLASSM